MHAARTRYEEARRCIVRAQALRRGCTAQRQFQALKHAAITLQVCSLAGPGSEQFNSDYCVNQDLGSASVWPMTGSQAVVPLCVASSLNHREQVIVIF